MSENHADKRMILEAEREQLRRQIDELTVGGKVEIAYDDDFADRGQVASEQGENQILADTLQAHLRLVEAALVRLDEGTYGTCEVCGGPISDERLDAMPATTRCIDHAGIV